ncbi:MAG: hypothetical protein WCT08_04230 [Patescibacteria group bacterium]|jgi:hypothetical protein
MDNNQPATLKTSPKPKKLIIIVVIAVLVIGGAVAAFAFMGKSKDAGKTTNTTSTNSASSSNAAENVNTTNSPAVQNSNTTVSTVGKVLGQSTGSLPYAAIDEAHVASAVIDSNGGVITATLPKNITAYLILPEGEVIQEAFVSLIPYTAMPSGQKHGYLSDELGYGVQVQIKSLQMGVRGYLVFDTTGGIATSEAVAKEKYFNRCDPNFTWFDPYLCAKKNKVSASTVVTKDLTVITPIHAAKLNSLVFPRNTIPTGINGLVALPIKGGDVFIPQKVDQALVDKLTQDGLSKYSSITQKLEATGLALAWGGNKFSQEQLKLIRYLAEENYYQEAIKAIAISQQFSNLLGAGSLTITRGEFDDMTNEELKADIDENLVDLAKIFLKDAQEVTQKFGFGIKSITAAAAISDAAQLGVAGASQALGTVRSNIESIGTSDSTSLGRRSSALESSDYTNSGGGEPQITPEILQGMARDVINRVWADPKATIKDILNAMSLARATALDNEDQIINEGLEKITKILEQMLKDAVWAKDFFDIAAIAKMLGLDDLADDAIAKGKKAPISQKLCDLVKKNLSNFGLNKCSIE